MKHQTLILCAALLLLTGVAAGAFGAHAIRHAVTPEMLATWNTAVLYQLVHGLGLMLTAQLYTSLRHGLLHVACYVMLAGTLLFSGSLYLLVLTGTIWFAYITPIGGVLFLIAWMLVGIAAWATKN